MSTLLLRCSIVGLALLWSIGCQKKVSSESAANPSAPVDLVARGRSVYQSNCIACHNMNPRVAGALGPDLAKSSLELIQSRVMKAEYPKDYKPKRSSHVMQPLPQLKDDIPALHAYLNSL
jgi:mono/diheme cytochrome c family protein